MTVPGLQALHTWQMVENPARVCKEQMVRHMKAAIVHKFGQPLVIEDVPIPQPGPDQILVKIQSCGVCHTDLPGQTGAETYCRFQLSQNIALTPALQFVNDPSLNPEGGQFWGITFRARILF